MRLTTLPKYNHLYSSRLRESLFVKDRLWRRRRPRNESFKPGTIICRPLVASQKVNVSSILCYHLGRDFLHLGLRRGVLERTETSVFRTKMPLRRLFDTASPMKIKKLIFRKKTFFSPRHPSPTKLQPRPLSVTLLPQGYGGYRQYRLVEGVDR